MGAAMGPAMDPEAIRIVTAAVGPLEANCHLILELPSRQAAVIDPGSEPERILKELEGFQVAWILATHAHFDHVGALRAIREKTGAPFLLHPADRELLAYAPDAATLFTGAAIPEPPPPDGPLAHGQRIRLGRVTLEVRHTPGHSPGSVSFILAEPRPVAFTGDTLFAGSAGRTDLPGGSAELLLRSIHRQLLTLPDACRVYPGHGQATTIGAERRTNPFLQGYAGG
ncbi:MAG: MBL fold metallo-hydrolase [Bacillota bacterium]